MAQKSKMMRWAGALLALASLVSAGCMTSVPDIDKQELASRAAVRRNLGIDHYLKGRVALAIRELRHAVTLEPNDPQTHMWLGEAYRRRGHFDLADVEMLRSLELNPKDHEANLRYSVLLIQAERFAESIEYANRLVDDPTFESPWRALTNRGWAQLKLGHYEEARRSFEDALEYHPAYWPAILNLGILSTAQGDYSGALQHLSDVAAADPGDGPVSEANYRMAEVFVSLGLRDRAIEHLERAIERSPKGRWGKQSRQYLEKLNGS